MNVNIYRAEFFARCPVNGARIHYHWTLTTNHPTRVEVINERLDKIREGLHEDIADDLAACFGSEQTLIAHHHGVTIETRRSIS